MKTRTLRRNPDTGQTIAWSVVVGSVALGVYYWWKQKQEGAISSWTKVYDFGGFTLKKSVTNIAGWTRVYEFSGFKLVSAGVAGWTKVYDFGSFVLRKSATAIVGWTRVYEFGSITLRIPAVDKFSVSSQMEVIVGQSYMDGSVSFSFRCPVTNNGNAQGTHILSWVDNVGLVNDWRQFTLTSGQVFNWEFNGFIDLSTFFSRFGRQEWVITLTGDWVGNNISVGRIDTTTVSPGIALKAGMNQVVYTGQRQNAKTAFQSIINYITIVYYYINGEWKQMTGDFSGYDLIPNLNLAIGVSQDCIWTY